MSAAEPNTTPTLADEGQPTDNAELRGLVDREYEHGFVTDIEQESLPPGLDEGTVRALSAIKKEPEWMLEWRLAAFAKWQTKL